MADARYPARRFLEPAARALAIRCAAAPVHHRSPHPTLSADQRRGAFTLIELMVVIGIIVLILAIAVPAIGPMLAQNDSAKTMNTLIGLAATAQSLAEANATPVGLRIERAFNAKDVTISNQPYKVLQDTSDTADQPDLLPHQQVRIVQFSEAPPSPDILPPGSRYPPCFEQVAGTRVTSLPKTAWVAPIECIERDPSDNNNPIKFPRGTGTQVWSLDDDTSLKYQPVFPPGAVSAEGTAGNSNTDNAYWFNRMDTFYMVFDRFGGLHRMPSEPGQSNYENHYWYRDRTQPYRNLADSSPNIPAFYPLVDHPDPSTRGVLVYDRNLFQELPNTDADRRAFLERARPLYISRSLGTLVEGRQ